MDLLDRTGRKDYNHEVEMDSGKKPHILFSRQEIEVTVSKLAFEITRDYRDKYPLIIGILKGSFVFIADLIRLLDFPLEVEFVRLSSYGGGKESSGEIEVVHGLDATVEGRDVLVMEDIIDTGLTTSFLIEQLHTQKPASLKLCALTEKPTRRQVAVKIDYLGFSVPDKFLVGYGLDFDEKFRNLPDICILEEDK